MLTPKDKWFIAFTTLIGQIPSLIVIGVALHFFGFI